MPPWPPWERRTVDPFARRRQRLSRFLKEEGLDAFLVSNPVNVTYLTGFHGDSSYLILTRKQAVLVSDGRYAEQIAEECPGLDTYIRPADTEKELCDNLELYVRRAGGWAASFPSIVAVGDRAALAHAPPTDRRVAEAGLLLIDWGASGRSYKSDLTRVLATHNISASP